jgi:hypothetical protein
LTADRSAAAAPDKSSSQLYSFSIKSPVAQRRIQDQRLQYTTWRRASVVVQ